MPDIEHCAIELQRRNAILTRTLRALMDDLQHKRLPADRVVAEAARVLRDFA